MIELAFYKADEPCAAWVDRLIAIWTKGPYSHVEIVIDSFMYSADPKTGKVRKINAKKNEQKYDYVQLEINEEQKNRILKFFDETKGDKYDWLGIIGFILPFKDRSKEWFCSEWCSNALKINGFEPLWTKEPSRISPNSLYTLIKEYKNEKKKN